MNDNTLVVIIAAIPPTLVALAAFIQSVRNNDNIKKSNVVQDGLLRKTEEIHVLTNRNFSEQKAEITRLQAEIDRLVKSAAVIEEVRAQLARETAHEMGRGGGIVRP